MRPARVRMKNRRVWLWRGTAAFACAVALFYIFFIRGAIEQGKRNKYIQIARELNLSFFQYANDHDGKYPDGKSSTEVFQKLLDGHYLAADEDGRPQELDILYFPMPGKVPASPGAKILKPENVCWDVTGGMETGASDLAPILFLTGRKVTYQAGASAVLLPHPQRTWIDWWQGKRYPHDFIVVAYRSGIETVLKADDQGTIANFIDKDFNPSDATFRQLTPDGELKP